MKHGCNWLNKRYFEMLLAATKADVNFKLHCIDLVDGEHNADESVLGSVILRKSRINDEPPEV